jgi:HlyD family secretion protein
MTKSQVFVISFTNALILAYGTLRTLYKAAEGFLCMSKIVKYLIPSFLLLALLVGIFAFVQPTSTVEAQDTETALIERRDVTVIVDGSGTISPERSLDLSFAVGGTVDVVNVAIGDTVTAGQVLASLDTVDLQLSVDLAEQGLIAQQANYNSLVEAPSALELAQADAAVAQAQSALASATLGLDSSAAQEIANCANLDSATDALESAQEAYEDYVQAGYEADPNFMPDTDSQAGQALSGAQTNYDITAAQCSLSSLQADNGAGVDAARANLAQAEAARDALIAGPTENQLNAASAQLRSAELQFEQAQNRLEDAQILAPFDGLITKVNVIVEQTVGVQLVAFTLVDISQLHIDVLVDELDIANIEVGQTAEITLDALEGTVLTGTVTSVSPQGILLQGIVTYDVEVGLDETDALIRLGMSADVEIQVAVLDSVLTVPRRAIHRNDELGEYLIVQTESGNQNVAVTPGYSDAGWIVVEGDISEGQTVLLNTENN